MEYQMTRLVSQAHDVPEVMAEAMKLNTTRAITITDNQTLRVSVYGYEGSGEELVFVAQLETSISPHESMVSLCELLAIPDEDVARFAKWGIPIRRIFGPGSVYLTPRTLWHAIRDVFREGLVDPDEE